MNSGKWPLVAVLIVAIAVLVVVRRRGGRTEPTVGGETDK